MINLKELEKEIDELLANETPESLRAWFFSQVSPDVECYIGEGDYMPLLGNLEILEENIHLDNHIATSAECEGSNVGYCQYAMAA